MNNPLQVISDFVFVREQLAEADVIMVPGSFSPQLMIRAAELWRGGLAPLVLPSGGGHRPIAGFASEWAFLRHHGIKNGIPEQCIIREDQARNTFENAIFSRQTLNRHDIAVRRAILVCKAFHSRRALMTYQTVFPPPVELYMAIVPCAGNFTADNWFLSPQGIATVMQEVEKIGRYFASEIPGFVRDFSVRSAAGGSI
ncbi:MAG: YdcF family protein [Negativicutes bacterium]|nr:YdcF family protein [Negativicutes bacterium]